MAYYDEEYDAEEYVYDVARVLAKDFEVDIYDKFGGNATLPRIAESDEIPVPQDLLPEVLRLQRMFREGRLLKDYCEEDEDEDEDDIYLYSDDMPEELHVPAVGRLAERLARKYGRLLLKKILLIDRPTIKITDVYRKTHYAIMTYEATRSDDAVIELDGGRFVDYTRSTYYEGDVGVSLDLCALEKGRLKVCLTPYSDYRVRTLKLQLYGFTKKDVEDLVRLINRHIDFASPSRPARSIKAIEQVGDHLVAHLEAIISDDPSIEGRKSIFWQTPCFHGGGPLYQASERAVCPEGRGG